VSRGGARPMLTKTNNSDLICILTWVVWDNEDAVIKNIKRHGMMRQSILCKKYIGGQ
jgi:hypothetical protein